MDDRIDLYADDCHARVLFVVTASHGILDAMTDGGLGIAFFAPHTFRGRHPSAARFLRLA
jgi:hypothetical protein